MSEGTGLQLPMGWVSCALEDVADLVRGIAFPKEAKGQFSDEGVIACLRTTNIQQNVDWQDLWWIPERYVRRTEQLVQPGDILISVANSYDLVGKVALVYEPPVRSTLGAFIALIRAVHPVDYRYLYYLMASHAVQAAIRNVASTTTNISNVNTTKVKAVALSIAPLREQERIADTLDELLSDLDAGVAALKRAQAKLKHYRAAVLKAAVEGALTAEWREQHPATEPASALLERILTERRRRWEEAQLKKFKDAGKEPPKDWKAKYKEPIGLEIRDYQALPLGWKWVSFDQIMWQLRSGNTATSGRIATNYPVLKSSAVRHGRIDFGNLNYLTSSHSSHQENFLQSGDFLITRLSGSIDYVGCSAVVPDLDFGGFQYPDRIFCGKLVEIINGSFLTYCFQHSWVRKLLEGAAKSTAGHQRISISDLVSLAIPVPPLAEQQAIVEAVEEQLSIIDHLEADLEAKLKSAQGLRQSILRHAFSGKLVPQDPNDEPASELLKRIAAEREERRRQMQDAKQSKSKSAVSRKRGAGRS